MPIQQSAMNHFIKDLELKLYFKCLTNQNTKWNTDIELVKKKNDYKRIDNWEKLRWQVLNYTGKIYKLVFQCKYCMDHF